MSSDFLFGGTPLVAEHFESDVAKAVFNDRGRTSSGGDMRAAVERRLMAWVVEASPKSIVRWSRKIDLFIVPVLSPSAFRIFCSFLCEHQPQVIENMPNTKDSVQSLARAVNLSRLINPDALDRIYSALEAEGLA